MKYYLTCFIVVSQLISHAQIVFDKTSHDFGILDQRSQRHVDFSFTNTSSKTDFILRTEQDPELVFRYTKTKLEPGEEGLLRVQYNPKQKGKFNKHIKIYYGGSPNPIEVSLRGTVLYLDQNALQDCPDFHDNPKKVGNAGEQPFNIQVIDAYTQQPLEKSQLQFLKGGAKHNRYFTNHLGQIQDLMPYGPYYIIVSANGYYSYEDAILFDKKGQTFMYELIPLPLPVKDTPADKVEDSEQITENTPLFPNLNDGSRSNVEKETFDEKHQEESYPQLPLSEFAPNNVVFLVDISISMKHFGRLDLLKASVIEMMELLRPIDKVGLVTYATETAVPLPSVSAAEKDKILKEIQALEAGGYTAGSKGIKQAYKVAFEHFIEGGNNQVILVTDGAFNEESDKPFFVFVNEQSDKGVNLSVIAIKSEKWTVKSMKEIARNGKGHYISVESYDEAREVLVKEIKTNSRRQ